MKAIYGIAVFIEHQPLDCPLGFLLCRASARCLLHGTRHHVYLDDYWLRLQPRRFHWLAVFSLIA